MGHIICSLPARLCHCHHTHRPVVFFIHVVSYSHTNLASTDRKEYGKLLCSSVLFFLSVKMNRLRSKLRYPWSACIKEMQFNTSFLTIFFLCVWNGGLRSNNYSTERFGWHSEKKERFGWYYEECGRSGQICRGVGEVASNQQHKKCQ